MTPATPKANGKGGPLDLPFDQYQRYRLVADLLAELRRATGRKAPLRVLDVGGRTALLRRFLERERITLVDLEPSAEAGLVLGDGARLPFQGASFDVVTAFDTLEHVPPPERQAFVAECRRVAKSWVVLAGPYHSARVAEAEELLGRFLGEKLGIEHRYLNEHRAHGLPERAAVEGQLTALGGRVASIGHANLDRWLVAMCLSMYMDADPALRGLATAFHRFYNASLYASDHAEPVYRHALVAAFEDAPLPDAARLLDPPSAPRGTLAGLRELAIELSTFDRERGEWRAERERLRRVAADLEQDLAGHRATLTAAQSEAGELAAVKLALEEDLSGHRASLAEARQELAARAEALGQMGIELERERRLGEESRQFLVRDLERLRAARAELVAELERERRDGGQVRAELQRRLDEHRDSLATRERELGEHRAVLAAREIERGELRAGLAALEAALAEERAAGQLVRETLSRDLEGHRAALAEREARLARLTGELQGAEQRVRELEAELRHRWRSFVRAVGPRRER